MIISLLLLALSAWFYVQTYSRMVEPGGYRSFAVSGDGKAVAVPDVAEFTFSVLTEGGQDLASLQADNTKKANAAIAYLKQQGLAEKDIQTSQYNVSPRYENSNCGLGPLGFQATTCPPPTIIGYTIEQTVTVKARDFTKVGTMLAGVMAAGANTVSRLNFTVDDPTAVESQARAEAIKKAKVKAEEIAAAGGFRLGRLISINENNPGGPYYDKAMVLGMSAAPSVAASPPPTIQPGSNEVSVNVTLQYEIN